jgi:ferric-dicitrate binding protein FerR (iron transport regulator)
MQGELDHSSQLSVHEINDPNFMAWKQNRLTFDNTALSAVVETLEEYFGAEIEVHNPLLLSCRFTGTFDKPTVDEVMKVLAVSTNSSYKIAGPKIILTGKGCDKN